GHAPMGRRSNRLYKAKRHASCAEKRHHGAKPARALMLRLVFITLTLALLALGAAWLSSHPGHMSITWLGWRVDASASFFLFMVAALSGVMAAAIVSSHLLLHFPGRWQSRRRERHHALGLRALTQSLVALADGDAERGHAALKSARKFLSEAPAILLL